MYRRLMLSCALAALMIVGCSQDPLLVPREDAIVKRSSTEVGAPELVFGPVVATRTAASSTVPGAPTEWAFTVTHPGLYRCEPTFRLTVTNGYPDGTGQVASAWVFVEGALTIGPSAFSASVPTIERDVALVAGSTITARVSGAPAGRLEIDVEGICLPLNGIVGTSFVPILRGTRFAESAQGNLVTDALIDQYAADFGFMNSGGLRADLTRPPTAKDPPPLDESGLYNITRMDVLSMLPFGNLVTLAEVDGPMLRAILDNGVSQVGGGRFIQVAGLRIDYAIDLSVDPADNDGWLRGVILNVAYWNHPGFPNGTALDLSASASYVVATNDFMAVGGDGYPVLGDLVVSVEAPLSLAVERYLQGHSPVNPQVEGRIVQVPMP